MVSPQMNQGASCPTKITTWQTIGHTAGAGSVTKLVNNLLLLINFIGACEGLA